MRKIVYSILIGLFIVPGLKAQTENKKARNLFQQAREVFRAGKPDEALGLLEKAITYDPAFTELYLLQADIFHKKGRAEEEAKVLESALKLDSLKSHPYYYLVLAEYYFGCSAYAKASEFYDLYLQRDKKQMHRSKVLLRSECCRFALEALNSQERQLVEVFIRSEDDVYWPSLDVTGGTVLYTRLQEGGENIWMHRKDAGRPLNINTPDGNEGTQSLTADGQMMYFTGCERPDSHGSCDIYVAYRLSDSLWSAPVNLGYPVNTDAWEAQPSVSADGTRLFFASTREGGKGGSDIWYSTLLERYPDGRQLWARPKLLYFNTPGNEMAPFLYYNGRVLFFSSDGYTGMGGMDIYRVELDSVSEPLNIGITVNTVRNEMGFAVDASGRWGYFSSDWDGSRNIYRYELEDRSRCEEMAYLRLSVRDESGQEMRPDKLLVIHPQQEDTLAYYDEAYAPGKMLSVVPAHSLLLISAQKAGYLYYSDTVRIERALYDMPREKVVVLRRIVPDAAQVLKGIFFDVNDYGLREDSRFELEQLVAFLKENPAVEIEIAGHTDNSGTTEYNARLSEARAFEVYKYLFLHHIRKERMQYKGYGEKKPLASNATEEGRARNRRTEIRIIR